MREEIVQTGKSVDIAIETACEKLGIDRTDCEWEILELPKKSFLGLRHTPAKVKVWFGEDEVETALQTPTPPQAKVTKPEPAKTAVQVAATKPQATYKKPQPQRTAPVKQTFAKKIRHDDRKPYDPQSESSVQRIAEVTQYLGDIMLAMKLTAEQVVTHGESGVLISLKGDDLSVLIGKRGETLDALQSLASLIANRNSNDFMRITVDCGNFRNSRKLALEELAKKLAEQVLATNVNRVLEPMSSSERRIIHATVSEIAGVSSTSVGEDPNRRVIITSPTARPAGPKSIRTNDSHSPRPTYNTNKPGQKGKPPYHKNTNSPRPIPPVQVQTVVPQNPKKTPEALASADKAVYTRIEIGE